MKVLVTGGAGFIGSHTVDALLSRGHEVRILDSLEPPVHNGEPPDYLPPEAEFIRGSVTDRRAFRRALKGVDAVFHFAAYQDYLTDFSHFFATNSVGTALLYEIIVNENLPISKIVIASSQAVYGEGKYLCPLHGVHYPGQRTRPHLQRGDWDPRCGDCNQPLEPVWTDESVTAPHNSYGLSKRDQEDIAVELGRRYDLPTVALRYSIVQGPRQSFRNAYSGALRSFAVRVLMGKPPVIFEDGRQLRDYVSIHDVVDANMLVFEDGRADYQVFNVGGDRRVTVTGLAWMVCHAAGVEFVPECCGIYRSGDTRHIFSDVSRLRALGWEPRVGQTEIVREYLDWASGQPDLSDTFAAAQDVMASAGVLRKAA
ncbi:MAG TPA: NAD-dependent epimerase/dehydratase family protein [Dehalococcoidia bacterium]|nr:NAD-dependent epimerase/dehydratase family protein [Dehalococcoidia bacterium]